MTVGKAKSLMYFSLRYLGQDVAEIKVDKEKVTISTSSFDNQKHFACPVTLKESEWKSEEAIKFRRHFSANPRRNNNGKKMKSTG